MFTKYQEIFVNLNPSHLDIKIEDFLKLFFMAAYWDSNPILDSRNINVWRLTEIKRFMELKIASE